MPDAPSALDTLRGQTATPQPETEPAQNPDALGVLRQQAETAPQPESLAAPTSAVDALRQQVSPTANVGGDESQRMGEGESFLTRPLSTRLGIPEYRQGAGPVERGVEKFASGLTSPLSLGLMLVTSGLGGLAEAGAAEAGESAITSLSGQAGEAILGKLAPETAAKVATASGVISKMANAGFTLQQIGQVADSVPRIGDAIKAGDYDTAMELGTGALLNGAIAGLSARHLARSLPGGKATEPTWTGDKDVIAASQQPVRAAGAKAMEFEKANAALIKNRPLDMAARLYHEAGGDNATLEKWRQDLAGDTEVKSTLRVKYDSFLQAAQNLPDHVKALSAQLKNEYAHDWEELRSMGKTHATSPGAGNYAGQHTYVPDDEGASSLRYTGGSKLTKSPGFTKERTFDTIMDAIHDGYEPKEVGLAGARGDYMRSLGGMRGAYAAENELYKQHADDARPLGVDPARVRTIDGKRVMRIDPKTALSALPEEGMRKVVINDGKAYWDVSDYKEGPDVFNRFRFRTTDKYGDPVFDKANVMIHPDYHEPVQQAFDDHSWFRKNPVMRAALAVSTQAKKSLLSFSPFHWTTEYLRGIQMGLNPVEALNPAELTPERLAVTAKFGPTLGVENSRGMAAEYAEGAGQHSALVNKIPIAGPLLHTVENKLFGGGGYIDRLKAATFDKVVDQVAKRHSNWSEDQVHFQSSKIVDAAFGGLNWKMLGASMNSQDALRLLMLAPDFTGSQLLFGRYGFDPGGSVVQQSLGRVALYNFAVARVLNLMTNGKAHMEHPFSVVSPDEKKVYSIRTMPQDFAHALSDPRGFIHNRMNPLLVRTAWEALSGRDDQGKAVTTEKQMLDVLRNTLPIPSQGLVPAFRHEGEGVGESVARGMGVAVEQNRSAADKLAGQLASNHSESGPVDAEKLAQHQTMIQFEDALRTGKAHPQDLYKAYEAGTISLRDAKAMMKNVQETHGMDDGTARLYTRVTRLPIKEFLKVWDVSTPPEKAAMEKLMMKRRVEYFKNAAREMSLAERTKDPVYKRLREMQPNEAPW